MTSSCPLHRTGTSSEGSYTCGMLPEVYKVVDKLPFFYIPHMATSLASCEFACTHAREVLFTASNFLSGILDDRVYLCIVARFPSLKKRVAGHRYVCVSIKICPS